MNEIKKLLLFLLSLILIVFAYRIVSSPYHPQMPTRIRISKVKAWPPFTMYYRDEWGTGMQRYKFVFNHARDWTHTTIESTQKESAIFQTKYTGDTMVIFDSPTSYTTTDTAKDPYPYIPTQWLSIGYIKGLQLTPTVIRAESSDPALEKLIETGEIPCDENGPSFIKCKPGQKVQKGSREITYLIDTLIPVLMVDKLEGVAVYTATVEKLEFR